MISRFNDGRISVTRSHTTIRLPLGLTGLVLAHRFFAKVHFVREAFILRQGANEAADRGQIGGGGKANVAAHADILRVDPAIAPFCGEPRTLASCRTYRIVTASSAEAHRTIHG